MQKGHLFFIMGVSGSGKGTLRENLTNAEWANLEFVLSYVTRDMRPWEVSWDKYHFISEESFLSGAKKWDFLEYEWVHKAGYYGTKRDEILDWISDGKILLKEIETKWLKQIIHSHPEFRKNFTSLFLDVQNEEMVRRYLERHPDGNKSDIHNRLESSNHEREDAKKYCDYIIDASQSPEKVLSDVLQIMRV